MEYTDADFLLITQFFFNLKIFLKRMQEKVKDKIYRKVYIGIKAFKILSLFWSIEFSSE